jgi:hypothetical protein
LRHNQGGWEIGRASYEHDSDPPRRGGPGEMSKGSCKDIDSEEREPMIDTAVILKRFEEPDEVRTFDKGRFEIVRIGGMSIGHLRARVEMV